MISKTMLIENQQIKEPRLKKIKLFTIEDFTRSSHGLEFNIEK